MKKFILVAFTVLCSVSFGKDIEPFWPEPVTFSCENYIKSYCTTDRGCNNKTSDEQSKCIEFCEEIAQSSCKH